MSDDRTVYGWDASGNPVVRYDRRSHWYVEPKDGKRRRVSIGEAAHIISLGTEARFIPDNLRRRIDAL